MSKYLELLYNRSKANITPFNEYFFEKDHYQIVEEVKNVILSLQRDTNFKLQVRGFKLVEDYIEVRELQKELYNTSKLLKSKKGVENNPYQNINMKDSDVMLLIVSYYIKAPKSTTGIEFTVPIYIPRFVNKYYFRIKGVLYSPPLQITDGSTYSNGRTVTQKNIFGPNKINRQTCQLTTYHGEQIEAYIYAMQLFNKYLSAMVYFFAKVGIFETAMFFEIYDYVKIYSHKPHVKDENYWDNNYLFRFGKDVHVVVNKKIFNEEPIIQSYISSIATNITSRTRFKDIITLTFWEKVINKKFESLMSYKGISVLFSLETLYDRSTKSKLNLPEEEKETIYHVIRWIMREYTPLTKRSPTSLYNKRLRMGEYIASMYAYKLYSSILRYSDRRDTQNSDIIKAIDIQPSFILDEITKSSIIGGYGIYNDNDTTEALKFTYEGPSGVGSESSMGGGFGKRGQKKKAKAHIKFEFKLIDLTQIGKLDPMSSSKKKSGVSGNFIPTIDIYNKDYIYEFTEPMEWRSNFNLLKKELDAENKNQQLLKLSSVINFDMIKMDQTEDGNFVRRPAPKPLEPLMRFSDETIKEHCKRYASLAGKEFEVTLDDEEVKDETNKSKT